MKIENAEKKKKKEERTKNHSMKKLDLNKALSEMVINRQIRIQLSDAETKRKLNGKIEEKYVERRKGRGTAMKM